MRQMAGRELQVGHVFCTVDGICGVVLQITSHKGWSKILAEHESATLSVCVFHEELLDVEA